MALLTTFYKLKKMLKGERNWDTQLNNNFDTIDTEMNRLKNKDSDIDNRMNNIVASAGTGNTEIVDARQSLVKGKTFPVMRNRLEESEKETELLLGVMQFENKNFDSNLGIYTLVEYRDPLGTLRETSELKTLDGNNRYTVREIKVYEPDGTTVRKTQSLSLSYDQNGKLYKETAI